MNYSVEPWAEEIWKKSVDILILYHKENDSYSFAFVEPLCLLELFQYGCIETQIFA